MAIARIPKLLRRRKQVEMPKQGDKLELEVYTLIEMGFPAA